MKREMEIKAGGKNGTDFPLFYSVGGRKFSALFIVAEYKGNRWLDLTPLFPLSPCKQPFQTGIYARLNPLLLLFYPGKRGEFKLLSLLLPRLTAAQI